MKLHMFLFLFYCQIFEPQILPDRSDIKFQAQFLVTRRKEKQGVR